MTRMHLRLATLIGAFAFMPALIAQTGPTPEELTVRAGDTLAWTTTAPHRLRFGGTVTHNGKPLAVTPFADIDKVLEFGQKPIVDAQGVARWPSGTPVTAKVRTDVMKSGVKEFLFTCGVDDHANMMVTVSFTIAERKTEPVRNVAIASANPQKWVMKIDGKDKDLKRP